jgi:spore germination cell wall hydrolase CwlJ-like protein
MKGETMSTLMKERNQDNLMILSKACLVVLGLLICSIIATKVVKTKFADLRELKGTDITFVTAAERDRQLACLSKNIYYEAGHENFEGKVAVAQVTMNRASSGQFPSDICGVVYQKNVVYSRVICQFSWYCETESRVRPINQAAFAESQTVARKVLLEGFNLPSLKNALYYHADYVNPGWGKEKIATIGRHIFYSGNKAKGN